MSSPRPSPAPVLTANQVVSYRLREARDLRGWTQGETAERLGAYLGVRWSEPSFSHAENGCRQGRRVRHFSADELVAPARCPELPLVFFLVPPPGSRLASSDVDADGLDRQVMVEAVLGTAESVAVLEKRLLAWLSHGRRRKPAQVTVGGARGCAISPGVSGEPPLRAPRPSSPRPARSRWTAPGTTGRVDANTVVSCNVAAIRRRRGWTQQEVAERLARFTGHQLPKASMSNMERGFERGRPRRFDAHELYLLSVVFDVPIAYFFLPPPASVGADRLAGTGRPLVDLYAAALGTDAQSARVDERLGEAISVRPETGEAILGAVLGGGPDWAEQYRSWRDTRLAALGREYGDRLSEIAAFLIAFAGELTASGQPRAPGPF